MAVDPNPQIYNAADDAEITAINFGTGDAGSFEDAEAGTEYHIWNDKGAVLGSSKMTSVKITVRDADGLEVENVTTQHWVEIKSTTIEEGSDDGDASGETDDNMADFQPVGKDSYLAIGDIPSDCYRIIFVRVNIPTSAIQAGVTFSIYVTNQEPSSSISKWLTGLFGDGVVDTGNKLEVTDNAGADSKIDIASGYALINDMEVYLSASQTYTISTTDDTYKIYLTRTGVISSTTGTIPDNSIQLATVVIASNVVSTVTDARTFIATGVSELSDLSDVGVTTPTDKNALMADGDSWESRALVEADISDLGSYAASGANSDITSLLNAALYVGRDVDNKIDWATDDHLKIKIGGAETDIVSISTGTGDNDKLVTQGYVDDNIGGYTNLTSFIAQTPWRFFYSDTDGDVTELALGADGTYLKSNGAAAAPTFATPAGGGDVLKVGTPADSQVGVWTGDGTLEGAASLTYDGANLQLTGDIGSTGAKITKGWFTDLTVANDIAGTATGNLVDLIDDTTPTLGGELDAGAHSIGFTQQSTTGDGTTTIDWKLGNKFYFTFGAQSDTFTFTPPTNPGNLLLVLKQDGTGSRLATWPATVMWPAGTAPTLTTTAAGIDICSFYWDGTNYFGVASLAFAVPA